MNRFARRASDCVRAGIERDSAADPQFTYQLLEHANLGLFSSASTLRWRLVVISSVLASPVSLISLLKLMVSRLSSRQRAPQTRSRATLTSEIPRYPSSWFVSRSPFAGGTWRNLWALNEARLSKRAELGYVAVLPRLSKRRSAPLTGCFVGNGARLSAGWIPWVHVCFGLPKGGAPAHAGRPQAFEFYKSAPRP